jgi:hypothetical protein
MLLRLVPGRNKEIRHGVQQGISSSSVVSNFSQLSGLHDDSLQVSPSMLQEGRSKSWNSEGQPGLNGSLYEEIYTAIERRSVL